MLSKNLDERWRSGLQLEVVPEFSSEVVEGTSSTVASVDAGVCTREREVEHRCLEG